METSKITNNNKYLGEAQKLKILQWQACVCVEGSRSNGQGWKTALAEALNVKPSAVTRLLVEGYMFKRKSKMREGLVQLEQHDIVRILGLLPEITATNHELLPSDLNQIDSIENFAFFARMCGKVLTSYGQEAAAIHEERIGRSQMRWRGTLSPCTLVSIAKSVQELPGVPISKVEEEQISAAFSVLVRQPEVNQGAVTTIVNAVPHSGIGYLLHRLLPRQPDVQKYYPGGFLHLHLDALSSLRHAGREVGRALLGERVDANRKGWADLVARGLISNGMCLVVHGASSTISDEDQQAAQFLTRVSQILEEASAQPGGIQRRCSRLLLVTWDYNHFRSLNKRGVAFVEFAPHVTDGENALGYFHECVDHYRLLRMRSKGWDESRFPRPSNNVIKRVQHHYLDKNETIFTPFPSSIRFRAFCATDVHSASPFDPTQGVWDRLDEDFRLDVPEISLSLSDVQTYIRSLKPSDRHHADRNSSAGAKELSTIRLGSTGLFYVSNAMFDKIASITDLVMPSENLPVIVDACIGRMLELNQDYTKLIMPLLARALVQEDWMKYGRKERIKVHVAIGDILLDAIKRNVFTELEDELPYSPLRQNREILFALEAIRHYVRAARAEETDEAIALYGRAQQVFDEFLESGIFSDHECNAKEHSALGFMSRAFGLDALKYEALQLLSPDGSGKVAPAGVSSRTTVKYFRELGISLTHQLRPSEAIEYFELAINATEPDSFDHAYVLSHKISAELEQGEVLAAIEDLKKCRAIELAMPEGSIERESIRTRNEARDAAIHFSQGKNNEIAPILTELAESGLSSYTGERALLFIDVSIPIQEKNTDIERLRDTLVILEQARNHSLREGFEHERLRLDIRRAEIYRLLGIPEVGVPILEGVGIELHGYGGSEIAFREFQFASAKTLADLGRTGYAFSAYAWPCFQALDRQGIPVRRQKARELCLQLLSDFTPEETLENQELNPFRSHIGHLSRMQIHPSFSLELLPPVFEIEKSFAQYMSVDGREALRFKLR